MWKSRSNLFLGPSLTDDGKIELLPDGIEPVKKVRPAGRNVLVEVGKYSLRQVRPHRVDGVVRVKYSVPKFQKPLPRSCQRDTRAR